MFVFVDALFYVVVSVESGEVFFQFDYFHVEGLFLRVEIIF